MPADLVQLPQGTLYCPHKSRGDPVLLIHGIYPGASHAEWEHNVRSLANRFEVHHPDLLGFGESDAPHRTFTVQTYHHVLRDLIATHIGRPTTIVAAGNSCAAAVKLAVFDDALVSKLVLVCPIEAPHHTTSLVEKFTQFVYGTLSLGVGHLEAVSEPSAIREFLEMQFAQPRRITKDLQKRLRFEAQRPNAVHPFISLITGYYDLDVYHPLRYVRRPTLVVWGSALGDAPRDEILAPAAWSQGKEIAVIDDAKHWPHVEQSARFNDAVGEWIARE